MQGNNEPSGRGAAAAVGDAAGQKPNPGMAGGEDTRTEHQSCLTSTQTPGWFSYLQPTPRKLWISSRAALSWLTPAPMAQVATNTQPSAQPGLQIHQNSKSFWEIPQDRAPKSSMQE